LDVFDQTSEAIALRTTHAHRGVKDLFRDLNHAIEQRAAARQNHAAGQLAIPTRVTDFIGHMHQNLFGARLQNVAEYLTRQLPRRAAAHRGHLNHFAPLGIAQ
jgi:hypothetical protein